MADRRAWGVVAATVVVAALLWYPLRHSDAFIDDYAFIALGIHLDNPLALLFQDSIGAFFFRPVGMLVWWFSVAAFGNDASLHFAFNLALHAASGLALYALLRRLGLAVVPAASACLGFLAHPSTVSTVAWISTRFDLLATLFGLLSLIALERYLETPSRSRRAAVLLLAAAAMLSKEVAFSILPAAILMAAWRGPRHHAANRRERLLVCAALAFLAFAVLAVRPLVIRGQASLLRDDLVTTLAGGVWKWAVHLPEFLVVLQGNVAGVAAWGAALVALVASAVYALPRNRPLDAGLVRSAAIGLMLMAAAAVTEAPVIHAAPLAGYKLDHFDISALIASRLYYLPFAGLAVFLAALMQAARATGPVAVAVGIAALAGLTATSRTIEREWSALVEDHSSRFVRAATTAVRAQSQAPPGCKIYFLDTPAPGRDFRFYADVAVKSALPRGHPALACFIQSEHAPWFHLRPAIAGGTEKPLEAITVGGRRFEPLHVGNVMYEYLKVPDSPAVRDDPQATFYSWDGSAFRDVTAEVREKTRQVHFFDVRPQQ